jgi:hypothetical protein
LALVQSVLDIQGGCNTEAIIAATLLPIGCENISGTLGDYFIAKKLYTTYPNSSTTTDFIIKGDGKVGIGTAEPAANLFIHTHGVGGGSVECSNNVGKRRQ